MAAGLTNLWKRLTKSEVDKWVELVEHPASNEIFAIRIKKGSYKDVVFLYGSVRFIEANGKLTLQYETTILENPRNHNVHSNKFKKLTGDILAFYLEQTSIGAVLDTEYIAGSGDKVIDESGD